MDLPVTLECGGRVSLFQYDNGVFILQSFLDRPEVVRVRVNRGGVSLIPLMRMQLKVTLLDTAHVGENESVFDIHMMPGRYAAFRID
jgi:hypothetical protein